MTHIQGFRFSAGMVLLLDVELSGRGKQGLGRGKAVKTHNTAESLVL